MIVHISANQFSGTVAAPSSKSYAHRMLICASLSDGPSDIFCSTISADIQATINCLEALGAEITICRDRIAVSPLDKDSARNRECMLDCGESGTTFRFLLPIICALGCKAKFLLHGRLAERPILPLMEELSAHGAKFILQDKSTLLAEGPLSNTDFKIDGGISSQFISGLLMTLPLCGGGNIHVMGEIQSSPYVAITVDCLLKAGLDVAVDNNDFSVRGEYKAKRWNVEGDWSNAAFWLCAGAFAENSVSVSGLNRGSLQGDRRIVELLAQFGAKIDSSGDLITIYPQDLHSIDIDAKNIPDLIPALCVCASAAKGETIIYNAERLRYKESDRLMAAAEVIRLLGGKIEEFSDGLTIRGDPGFHNADVDAWNDHRIAMMASIAAIRSKNGVTLHGAECVKKSYPRFFKDYQILGGNIERMD